MGIDSGGFAGFNPPRGLGGNPSALPPLFNNDFQRNARRNRAQRNRLNRAIRYPEISIR